MSSVSLYIEALDIEYQSFSLEVWLHGLYTILVFTCLFGYFRQRKQNRRPYRWLFTTVTIFMYICSTLHLVVTWSTRRNGFVFNRGSSPQQTFAAIATIPFWADALGVLAFSINTLIADCLFIWRSYIIWGGNWKIVIPSGLITAVGTAFAALSSYAQLINAKNKSFAQGGNLFVHSNTIYLSLSCGTTILVTLLITGRILWYHRKARSAFGPDYDSHHGSYLGVIELIVESAVLYSSAEIALLVLLVRLDTNFLFAQSVVAQVTGMAPTLILVRIWWGYARPAAAWQCTDSDMRFASGNMSTIVSIDVNNVNHKEIREGSDDAIC